MKAIKIRQVGIGDGVQFTSLSENYYRTFGRKLIDISRPWYFDYNPYVDRITQIADVNEKDQIELWNYPKKYEWPRVRDSVYLSNAEIHASLFNIKHPKLIRPRLYRFEDFKFNDREMILFHPFGKSHGAMPEHVIDHVLKKYRSDHLYQIGLSTEPDIGIKRIKTETMWDLAEIISKSRMLIGIDSGPSWIACCYPDVVVKRVRVKFQYGYCEPNEWVPLDVKNPHSFWDDRAAQIFNTSDEDIGFTQSYKRL